MTDDPSPAAGGRQTAADLRDAVISSAFHASLELHAALSSSDDEHTTDRVRHAIGWVDDIVLGLRHIALAASDQTSDDDEDAWSHFVRAVDQAGPAYGVGPTLTAGGPLYGFDPDTLRDAARQLAEIMALLREDTLTATRVEIGARLTMLIEAPNMVNASCALPDLPGVQVETRRSATVRSENGTVVRS